MLIIAAYLRRTHAEATHGGPEGVRRRICGCRSCQEQQRELVRAAYADPWEVAVQVTEQPRAHESREPHPRWCSLQAPPRQGAGSEQPTSANRQPHFDSLMARTKTQRALQERPESYEAKSRRREPATGQVGRGSRSERLYADEAARRTAADWRGRESRCESSARQCC